MTELRIPIEFNEQFAGEMSPALVIVARKDGILEELSPQKAEEYGVAPWQLYEASEYEYGFTDPSFRFHEHIEDHDALILPSRRRDCAHAGIIKTHNYVGRVRRKVFDVANRIVGTVEFEVRSKKLDYIEQYKYMLGDIAEKCDELLMLQSSPVMQTFEVDQSEDSKTLYERFSFVKAILDTDDFSAAIQRVCVNPMETVTSIAKDIMTTRARRIDRSALRQFIGSGARQDVSMDEELLALGLESVPRRIQIECRELSHDTPENRFVKFVLETFETFLEDLLDKPSAGPLLKKEVGVLVGKLESMLADPFFREVGRLHQLPLQSPLLQRRDGYRQIFRCWILFDCAAKFVWKGGDDVYDAGKRDVATLYEYWVYFQLVDVVKKVFNIDEGSVGALVKPVRGGMAIQLKHGEILNLTATSKTGRVLNVRFAYNRSFGVHDLFTAGSWSVGMRPDYTLSIWPGDLREAEAELEEAIVHVHFDAKYRIEKSEAIFGRRADASILHSGECDDVTDGHTEEYQVFDCCSDDLLKMHAYNDAIRRTYGSYVIYPGDASKSTMMQEYHEIIPGLGAFALQPTQDGSVGREGLERFISDIRDVMIDRMTQRERAALHRRVIYRDKPKSKPIEAYASWLGDYGKKSVPIIPAEEKVLVGYCTQEQLAWVAQRRLYNFRFDKNVRGAIRLTSEFLAAKFLLLHTLPENRQKPVLLRLAADYEVFTSDRLVELGYPMKKGVTSSSLYWVVKIAGILSGGRDVEISALSGYRGNEPKSLHLPFVTTLEDVFLHMLPAKQTLWDVSL